MFIKEIPAIAMEFAEHGNVNDYLKSLKEPMEWNLRIKWAVQLTNVIGKFTLVFQKSTRVKTICISSHGLELRNHILS